MRECCQLLASHYFDMDGKKIQKSEIKSKKRSNHIVMLNVAIQIGFVLSIKYNLSYTIPLFG